MTTFLGWLCLLAVPISLGMLAGIAFANWWADQRQQILAQREAKLQAEWEALRSAQRLHAAFLEARRDMWEAAIRYGPQPRPKPGSS